MQLTPDDIQEFKAIYKRQFGQDITDEQARDMGARLLRAFEAVLEPEVSIWEHHPDLSPADNHPK